VKIRIIAWTDRGEIDVTREWDDEVGGYGFVAREKHETTIRDALTTVSAQVAASYDGGKS